MACTSANDSVIVETQPLHENQEHPQVKSNDDTDQVGVSLLGGSHPNSQANNGGKPIDMEPAYQTTIENPYKDTTVTVEPQMKKVPQDDLTPRPWKTFNQVLILSYISVVFCLCSGIFANREAWKAKLYNGKGLYGLAQKRARRAVLISYVSIFIGFLLILFIPLGASGAL